MKPTTRFRELLNSPELELLLDAHNGISAKIAEEAGFKALWVGGLCLSAQFGVRDSNEASWTQTLEMLEFMLTPPRFRSCWTGTPDTATSTMFDAW